jgi:hypothetical protein
VKVLLDRQLHHGAHLGEFAQADGTEFRQARARIAQAVRNVVIMRINPCKQPCRACIDGARLSAARAVDRELVAYWDIASHP